MKKVKKLCVRSICAASVMMLGVACFGNIGTLSLDVQIAHAEVPTKVQEVTLDDSSMLFEQGYGSLDGSEGWDTYFDTKIALEGSLGEVNEFGYSYYILFPNQLSDTFKYETWDSTQGKVVTKTGTVNVPFEMTEIRSNDNPEIIAIHKITIKDQRKVKNIAIKEKHDLVLNTKTPSTLVVWENMIIKAEPVRFDETSNHYDYIFSINGKELNGFFCPGDYNQINQTYVYLRTDKGYQVVDLNIIYEDAGTVTPPPATDGPLLSYQVHGQKYGWQNVVNSDAIAGTTGQAKRLEAVKIGLDDYSKGGIEYRVHMQKLGWSAWENNGTTAGTTGQARRLEAIEINLTGDLQVKYNVYYRVHMQKKGWSQWVKNGEIAGTTGQARRIEAMQVKLVKIGDPAPQ